MASLGQQRWERGRFRERLLSRRCSTNKYVGSITSPANNNVAVGSIQVSGSFAYPFYVRKPDRITVKITKMGDTNPADFTGNAMTAKDSPATFDTDRLPVLQRPIIPDTGTYVVEDRDGAVMI